MLFLFSNAKNMAIEKTSLSIIKDLKYTLTKDFGENIHSVILFGSRSEGSANITSDYDIIVILRKDYDWKFEKKLSKTVYQFEMDTGIFADFHLISVNQMNNTLKGKDPLFANAIRNGVYA